MVDQVRRYGNNNQYRYYDNASSQQDGNFIIANRNHA